MSLPYCDLSLSANLASGSITTAPCLIVLDPVPVGVTIREEFLIIMNGFIGCVIQQHDILFFVYTIIKTQLWFCVCICRNVELDVCVPHFEDGVHCVAKFPGDCKMFECSGIVTKCPCVLEFSSTLPISRMDFLTVTERTSGYKLVFTSTFRT